MWTALQFDSAVLTFGRHVDNKLAETDRDGRRVNSLERLLDIEPTPREWARRNKDVIRTLKIWDAQSRRSG